MPAASSAQLNRQPPRRPLHVPAQSIARAMIFRPADLGGAYGADDNAGVIIFNRGGGMADIKPYARGAGDRRDRGWRSVRGARRGWPRTFGPRCGADRRRQSSDGAAGRKAALRRSASAQQIDQFIAINSIHCADDTSGRNANTATVKRWGAVSRAAAGAEGPAAVWRHRPPRSAPAPAGRAG